MFQAFSPSNLSDFHLARGAAEEVRGRHTCHLVRPALAAGLPLTPARARTRGGNISSGAAVDLVSNVGAFLPIRILVCR